MARTEAAAKIGKNGSRLLKRKQPSDITSQFYLTGG
jgi:hypothetical protein